MNVVSRISEIWRRVGLFVVTTYVISALFKDLAIVAGSMGAAGKLYALGGMWSLGIAAFLVASIFGNRDVAFGWRWGKTRYHPWCALIPLL